ncbi:hypothetical protein ACF8EA_08550 [Pseudomonas sp. YQ_5]|uniref:hypothetical protein n=1 Tax=Pseudomonas sp. YQ_5 TaxID=3367229 RepID=UPI00370A49C0
MLQGILTRTAKQLSDAWGYPTVIDWYNERSAPNEMNVLVRFAAAAAQEWKDATAFYEVKIDCGRIDLLIVSPDAILIVEGKTTFHSGAKALIASLNSQVDRIHGEDGGVRRLIDRRIPSYCRERWGLEELPPIYVVVLAWCNSRGLPAWSGSKHWNESLANFESGNEKFNFNGDEHYLLYKYKASSGIGWC